MVSSPESGGAREWATRVVQWTPARTAIKLSAHRVAKVRAFRLERAGSVPEIANIYAVSSPKAGSQWLKALFHHPVVREHTGLFTLPQLNYQLNLGKPVPNATFVPGMYVSRAEYLARPKPRPFRSVYLSRDPRDLIVSGYTSAVETHRKLPLKDIEQFRDELRAMSFDDALEALIRANGPRLAEMESWVDVPEDETLAKFRLEEVGDDPRPQVRRMLEHCQVFLSDEEMEIVLNDVSRDALQAKDLATRKAGQESHYRVNRKTFRDVFKPRHYEAMEEMAPGLAARMGYPD